MRPPIRFLAIAYTPLSALVLCALLAWPVHAEDLGPRPPANPWLGGLDGAGAPHNDASASDVTDLDGPGVGAVQAGLQVYFANCSVSLIHSEGNPVVSCFEFATRAPRVRILDKDDPSIVLSTLLLPQVVPLASAYAYLDNLDQLVAAGGPDSLIVVQTKNDAGDWDLQIIDEFDLSDHVPAGDYIIAMNPAVDGAIWSVTDNGVVVRLDPFNGEIDSVDLEAGERVGNSSAGSGDGKVAVASDRALYLFKHADDDDGEGYIKRLWREEYDSGSARKPGKLAQGTGSSPTFFGPKKGNEYVTIADNHDAGDRVMIFQNKNKKDPLVCIVEPPGDTIFGSENSPIGLGSSVVYTSTYGYRYPIEDQLPPAVPPAAPLGGGMFRVDVIGKNTKAECELVWHNPDLKGATVPKLSAGDETIYTIQRFGPGDGSDAYAYTAIDYHTGDVVRSQVIGLGTPFNTNQLAGNIGLDQALYQGSLLGLIKVQPAP